jgi:hypothetical protein
MHFFKLGVLKLIRECKEVLYAATLVKQYYQFMVDPVMADEQEAEEKFASDLDQFDQDLKQMLEVIILIMGGVWWERGHRTCLSRRFTYTRSLRKLLPF